jgi:hypothetical protein
MKIMKTLLRRLKDLKFGFASVEQKYKKKP